MTIISSILKLVGFPIDKQNRLALARVKSPSLSGPYWSEMVKQICYCTGAKGGG